MNAPREWRYRTQFVYADGNPADVAYSLTPEAAFAVEAVLAPLRRTRSSFVIRSYDHEDPEAGDVTECARCGGATTGLHCRKCVREIERESAIFGHASSDGLLDRDDEVII